MSHYKPYPAYRDSGVEWIGKMPEHWKKMPFKRLATICNGRDYKEVESSDGAYPVIGSGGEFARASDFMFDGESVLLGRKGTIDKPLYINGPFWAVDTMFYTKIAENAFPKFVYYNALTIPFGLYSTNTALPSMTGEDLSSHLIAAPAFEEQKAIATGLDRESTRIDALITKKTRFIELLKEKRQALITHAVTKGLDPNVPMKDSGVEWIGKVPAHWNVVQSRRLFEERRERAREGDVQFTASQKYGVIPQTEFMEKEGRRVMLVGKGQDILKHIEPGDFLISMRSFEGGLEECRGSGSVSSAYVPLIPVKWVWNPFFKYLFKSNGYIQALQSTSDLVRDGQALRFENFSKVSLLEIPIDEQKQISVALDRETARIDLLADKTQRSINLLKERRAAFITAAVTGQIDLRESA